MKVVFDCGGRMNDLTFSNYHSSSAAVSVKMNITAWDALQWLLYWCVLNVMSRDSRSINLKNNSWTTCTHGVFACSVQFYSVLDFADELAIIMFSIFFAMTKSKHGKRSGNDDDDSISKRQFKVYLIYALFTSRAWVCAWKWKILCIQYTYLRLFTCFFVRCTHTYLIAGPRARVFCIIIYNNVSWFNGLRVLCFNISTVQQRKVRTVL